jgi:superfamily II DNA or RNA helicase
MTRRTTRLRAATGHCWRVCAPTNGLLLGLTATPTRTSEAERPVLARLFPGRVLYEVTYVDLMRRKILAEPVPFIVPLDGPPIEITPEIEAYLRQWHQLPPKVLATMARDELRAAAGSRRGR